jgi:glycosyltransferase involved in cell wall biosynthesis
MTPLFSVIMPSYNREQYVSAALNSVLGQTCIDWECIVVDDGSSDSTRSIVREFSAKDQRIRLIERANGGPGAARNQGAADAKGKYLAFLDSDDLWMGWTLETYRDALDRAGWPEYLSGHQIAFCQPSDLQERKAALEINVFKDAIDAFDTGKVESGAGMTVVRTDTFRQIGGFWEERINAEDNDLTLRVGTCRGYVAVRNPVTIAYRRHGSQQSESQANNLAGILRLVERERAGIYPGGAERAHQRRAIIATHARPVCLAALRTGEAHLAWKLYWATFEWQLQSKRWRFLAAFPLLSFKAKLLAVRYGTTP